MNLTFAHFGISICAVAATASTALAFDDDHGITLNEVRIAAPPAWLKTDRVQKVVDRIDDVLEWDIHRVNVVWYTSQPEFERTHGFGPNVLAYARMDDNSIHVGPHVDATNFDGVFGHELVHIVVYQKFKNAVPPWLNEGLANYIARNSIVDYPWLAAQPIHEVTSLVHPFVRGPGGDRMPISYTKGDLYHYMASTAAMEMIATHCDVAQLLELSIGKSMKDYLPTFCHIHDVDKAFRDWVLKKAGRTGAK